VFTIVHRTVCTFIATILQHMLTHLRTFPPCLGSSSPWLFDPNIWCPPCSKPEGNPDNATKTNQPTSPPRRRLHTNLRSIPNPPPIHSGPPQSLRAQSTQPLTPPHKSNYNQPTCPPLQQTPARMAELSAPPKPMEVLHTKHR
jgi:hypothetical protein